MWHGPTAISGKQYAMLPKTSRSLWELGEGDFWWFRPYLSWRYGGG